MGSATSQLSGRLSLGRTDLQPFEQLHRLGPNRHTLVFPVHFLSSVELLVESSQTPSVKRGKHDASTGKGNIGRVGGDETRCLLSGIEICRVAVI